jgi:SAM-dependent methyltransferase
MLNGSIVNNRNIAEDCGTVLLHLFLIRSAMTASLVSTTMTWASALPAGDVAFLRQGWIEATGRILEVGCGTGRIALPLVEAGCQVLGVDVSLLMLQQMSQNALMRLSPSQRTRLRWACMDMKDLGISETFSLVLCPYSAFTYLLEEADRTKFLSRVSHLLSSGGRFILDVFVPRYDILCQQDEHILFDYRRELPGGLVLNVARPFRKI